VAGGGTCASDAGPGKTLPVARIGKSAGSVRIGPMMTAGVVPRCAEGPRGGGDSLFGTHP
jgi:hypothetical protein